MILPSENSKLGPWLKDKVIDPCRASVEDRIKHAKSIKQWLYTGSDNSTPSIFNKTIEHCDKLSSNLYSPADVRFLIETENDYGKETIGQCQTAARYLTREIARRDLDLEMGVAVEVAVPYGAAVVKSLWTSDGPGAQLLMPWQIGVWREDETSLDKQEAITETTYITQEQFWRRISHRRDAQQLWKRAKDYAKKDNKDFQLPGGLAQILLSGSAPLIQAAGDTPAVGGSLGSEPQAATLSPDVAGSLLKAHEVYVVNDETGDYTTLQLIEPDILIHPRSLRTNLFIPYEHPYSLFRPNPVAGYIWGRSELADLILLQAFLRDRLYDIKDIMNLQYTRLFAFIGFSGMNDERYDSFKEAGWIANDMPGAKVEDLTPKLPEQAFEELDHVVKFFDVIAGYDNVLSGKGEPGIRSAGHFQGALRAASPRLRDRAVRVERQVAAFAEKTMWMMAAKDARAHWVHTEDPGRKSDFILSLLPEDARVTVAGHSSSPIFEQDFANMAAFLKKDGDIDGEDVLDLLPVPNRDNLKQKLRDREAAKAKMMEELKQALGPEAFFELTAGGGRSGGGRGGARGGSSSRALAMR